MGRIKQPPGILAPHDARQWSRRDATHLLWRTQFGATAAEIAATHKVGLAKSLERLLTPQKETADFEDIESLLREAAYDTGAVGDLQAWWLHRMHYTANPLTEKLTLFWHNHFATSFSKVQSVPHMTAQNDRFRAESLGSFRTLLHAMAKDVAMLIWLDSNANRKRHANENFAREVMELFSLGEGNYTEDDIKQAARAFTGWHVRDDKFWFNQRQHDITNKSLFGKTANLDGGEVIDLCLAHKACARFIAFKEPLELTLGACRALGVRPNLQAINRVSGQLGQSIFEPSTVKGWEGGRLWITSASLLQRNNFAMALLNGQMGQMTKPNRAREFYRELLLSREVRGMAKAKDEPRKLVHLMMTLPEFQLT